jgi:hypothetical protein
MRALPEARGWWWSQEKSKWYTEQLAAHGMKGIASERGLEDTAAGEWRALNRGVVMRAGADGPVILDAYRGLSM